MTFRELYESKSFTLETLASKAGVTSRVLLRWRNGLAKRPHPSSLRLVARALKVSEAVLRASLDLRDGYRRKAARIVKAIG